MVWLAQYSPILRDVGTFVFALVIACPALGQIPPFVTSWGGYGNGDSQFFTPMGVAVDSAARARDSSRLALPCMRA